MFRVATAGAVADAALKLWAVSDIPSLRETSTLFGLGLVLVFNRRPAFDYEHLVLGQAVVVMIKFLALGYLGWRLKGWWRWLGLGLVLGGAVANVGNWLLTRAVVDFLVMPWATVNLADLLIVTGAAVIGAGWGARVLSLVIRRTRPAVSERGRGHGSPAPSGLSQFRQPPSKKAIGLCAVGGGSRDAPRPRLLAVGGQDPS
jgi:lipoprotein signal peptidase